MAANEQIRLLIVDDHPIVRVGLKALVSAESDMPVVAEAATGAEAVQAFRQTKPDVVLMDLLLPDMSGRDAIQQICKLSAGARVIVLTTLGGDEEIYRALEAGARGYLFKDMVREELTHAIRTVAAGGRCIPAEVGARIAENLPRPDLTSREIEVLRLLGSGLRNKEIAYRLGVAEGTINTHVKRILEKLQANDRTHAVMIALRRGIIRL
ncbi:MAG: response regulator transcription factor [Bryobacterales bacterium]|nr:response regulator transcription factor [Bryobacterales bacterium]